MDNDLFLDTRFLRDHVSEVKDERRITQRLYDTVKYTRDLGKPELAYSYNRLLSSIDELETYFMKMADVLEDISFDADQLYARLGSMIQDDTYHTRAQNKNIML